MPYSLKAAAEGTAPTGGKKLTRAEAARHASLVRWKKESPFAANVQERLAQIRAKRLAKAKGGKGKAKGKGKPAKDARTPQEKANQNRAAISKETGMSDLEGPLVRIGAGMSSDLEPEAYDKLIKKGLARRLPSGKTVLTPSGKKFRSAADKGDADGARNALAEGEGKARESADKEKAKADKQGKAKAERQSKQKARKEKRTKTKEKAEPKEDKPADKPASATPEENRAAVLDKMAKEDMGINKNGHAQLAKLAAGEGMDDTMARSMEEMGLVERDSEGKPRATTQGRAVLRAIDKGDFGGAVDAISRAKDTVATRQGRAKEKVAREKAQGDKAKGRADERNRRTAERAKRDTERQARSKGEQDKRVAAEVARIAAARSRKGIDMEDLTPVVEDMEAVKAELADIVASLPASDLSTKAGRRNATGDQARIDQIYELAMDLCDLAEALGADTGEEEEEGMETAEGGEVEMVEGKTVDSFIIGDAVKALAGGGIGGLAVRFGSEDEPDMSPTRDYFTKSTSYWLDAWERRPMLYHHAMEESTADDPVIGTWTKAAITNEGVWLEGELNRSYRYHAAIKELVRRGALRISTDSAPHLVRREAKNDGVHEIKRWPIVCASLTVSPAEPRLAGVSFKSLMDELGLPDQEDTDDEKKSAIELELIEIEREQALTAGMAG